MSLHPVIGAIIENKREEIDHLKMIVGIETLREAAQKSKAARRPLVKALLGGGAGMKVIAEVKRSSPTRCFRPVGFDPVGIAKGYESAGAVAVSVLTESRFFSGSASYVPMVRAAMSLPVLRKDFIVDRWQVAESAALGADAVLLMAVNFPDTASLAPLYQDALDYGLEALVEIHSEKDWELVKPLKPKLVGINNRDFLSSELDVDIQTSARIAPLLPEDVAIVSESGISRREEMAQLLKSGVHGFLIGSSLMQEEDPGEELRKLLGG